MLVFSFGSQLCGVKCSARLSALNVGLDDGDNGEGGNDSNDDGAEGGHGSWHQRMPSFGFYGGFTALVPLPSITDAPIRFNSRPLKG